jgi:hypothetical protein
MAGVRPVDLAAEVHAVAVVLDGAPVRVIDLTGRETYSFESGSAAITVSVHVDTAPGVDQVADLLGLDQGEVSNTDELYTRGGHRQSGVYVHLFGPSHRPVSILGVTS